MSLVTWDFKLRISFIQGTYLIHSITRLDRLGEVRQCTSAKILRKIFGDFLARFPFITSDPKLDYCRQKVIALAASSC